VDSEWIGGETLPRQPLVRCSVSSTTTRHLTSSAARPADNSSCLFATIPPRNTTHHPPPPRATRTTTAAVPTRRAAASGRSCRIIPTQYTVRLPCLLRQSPSQPRNHACRSARRQHSYRQAIRPKCDSSRLLAALYPYTAVAFS
jgi:hypothetical protein